MKIWKVSSKHIRILNNFIDIDIGKSGKNKWFEIRLFGLGIDYDYTDWKENPKWSRYKFNGSSYWWHRFNSDTLDRYQKVRKWRRLKRGVDNK